MKHSVRSLGRFRFINSKRIRPAFRDEEDNNPDMGPPEFNPPCWEWFAMESKVMRPPCLNPIASGNVIFNPRI